MSARSWVSARWIAILLVLTLIELAGCTTEDPTRSPQGASGSTTTGPPEVQLDGRILFSRIAPSGEFRHFVVGTDGSGEAPFVPGKQFEARNLSPDGSVLAISALNNEGLFVGGTVGVDGTGYRLFVTPDRA